MTHVACTIILRDSRQCLEPGSELDISKVSAARCHNHAAGLSILPYSRYHSPLVPAYPQPKHSVLQPCPPQSVHTTVYREKLETTEVSVLVS